MLLISRKLSKLAVSAYLVCVLMVIICGTRVLCVKLYNDCSKENISVDRKGRVYAWNKHKPDYQNLTVTSRDFTGKLSIYAEKSHRYLCFNFYWKLVGLKKHRGNRCLFYEEMLENGYTRYRSVDDETKYVGFTKKGFRMNDTTKPNLPARMQKCLNFLKLDSNFNISQHNSIVGRANISEMMIRNRQPSASGAAGGGNKSQQRRNQDGRRGAGNRSSWSAASSSASSATDNVAAAQKQSASRPIRIRHRNHHQTQNLNDIT